MGFPRQSYTPGTGQDLDAKNGCLNHKLAEITYTFECDEELEIEQYTHKLAIPEKSKAISWVKWKTPKKPCQVLLKVSANSDDAKLGYETKLFEIVDPLDGTYPPNTEATDRNDNFNPPTKAKGEWNIGTNNTLTWSTYTYNWHYYWVWGCRTTKIGDTLSEWGLSPDWDSDHICDAHECPQNDDDHTCPTGRCHGVKQDWGWVEWQEVKHTATLSVDDEYLHRSKNSPNTNNSDKSIKSGYGIEFDLDTKIVHKIDGSNNQMNRNNNYIVPPQFMEMYLPEYNYETYKIVSKNDIDEECKSNNHFNLPINPYSQFEQNCHFTPIWYPDSKYVVGIRVSQCYCPAGMLYYSNDSNYINIEGNAYDDWHIAPQKN